MPDEVTYFAKDDIICPVCGIAFKREELRLGGGRLNAGELTNELRRTYIPTQKYGAINPLIYPITVCYSCLYAADDFDFLSLPQKAVESIKVYHDIRAQYLIKIFERIPDFQEKRDLFSGAASYILAMSCIPFFDRKRFSPTMKIGIYSLRSAWLFSDLFLETKDPKYQELSLLFYKKAAEFYDTALNNQNKEPIDGAKSLGPDTDKNFGYDGMLYVAAVLQYKTAHFVEDPYEKLRLFEETKRILSKVFGMGRKAKDKPEVLLNFSREIYDKLGEETESLQVSLNQIEGNTPETPPEEGE
jgi:uncharacterized protein (DUF2225 family)